MISAFWMMLILFGISGLCTVFSRRRIEEWFAFGICAIIVVLYVFALCGVPVTGYQTIKVFGLIATAVTIVVGCKNRSLLCRLMTPGSMAFAIWMIIAWWAHRGQMYNTYDEFNHWGTAVNRLYVLERLPSTFEGLLEYPSYPPGSTLFYCFYTWLGGNFSEGNTISAANIFMVSCLTPLMKHTTWKQWKHILPMGLVCVMLPMVFKPMVYQDLYVDVLLGCLSAYILITWFTSVHDRASAAITCGTLCVLPLIKESGSVIVLLTLIVMQLDAWKNDKQEWKKSAFVIGVSLGCVLMVTLSWKIFLSAYGIVSEKTFRSWEIAENVHSFLNGTAPSRLKAQYRNFFILLGQPEMMGGGHILQLGYVEWMLVLALLACWLKRGKEDERSLAQRHGAALAMAMVITAVYAVCLYHTYMYAFPYSEAASLHSFDRYMSTLMMPAVSLAAALSLEKMHRQPPRAVPSCLILLTCLALIVPPSYLMSLTFTATDQIAVTQESRARSTPAPNILKELQENDKVAWISAETERTAFDYLINHYEFQPVQLNKLTASWWLETESVEEIGRQITDGGYTHVYCFYADERFLQKYSDLFENPKDVANKTLYEIIQLENNLKLRKVI